METLRDKRCHTELQELLAILKEYCSSEYADRYAADKLHEFMEDLKRKLAPFGDLDWRA